MYGGRGGGKSWTVAQILIIKAHTERGQRIGCFRELQSSIKDSVHQLLKDQIEALGLTPWFEITLTSIRSLLTGSEFMFKGLRHNYTEIKSTEGITIAWVEEAQLVSKDSWEILIPTIRREGSELWITFNPLQEDDETYRRFVINTPPDGWVAKINFDSNPWFPEVLDMERLYMLKNDPEGYEHVWAGRPQTLTDAIIFKGKYTTEPFGEPPYGTRLFHGADFGFANDPATLMRCWITGKPPEEHLWVDYAIFCYKTEIDHLEQQYDKCPTARSWPIKADNARPETISYLKRRGFNISAAEKWTGCVEDRISHLKGFKQIHIQPHLKEMLQEARLYSYKVDKNNGDILPEVVDANNHGWDGLGYALDGYIQKRGIHRVWANL